MCLWVGRATGAAGAESEKALSGTLDAGSRQYAKITKQRMRNRRINFNRRLHRSEDVPLSHSLQQLLALLSFRTNIPSLLHKLSEKLCKVTHAQQSKCIERIHRELLEHGQANQRVRRWICIQKDKELGEAHQPNLLYKAELPALSAAHPSRYLP